MDAGADVLAADNALNKPGEEVGPKAPWDDLSATAKRILALTFAGQLVLLGLMLFAGMLLSHRLTQQENAAAAQRAEGEDTRRKIEALTADTQAVRQELSNLRQTVASHAGEDVLFLKVLLLKPSIDVALASAIAAETHRQAQLVQRDPNLVLAIMAVESDFNPKATSSVGAVGLMQVMPHWKRVLGISGDLYDIPTNIRYGLQVLGFYLEMYQDLELAITAYNRGPGPIDHALMKGKDHRNGYSAKVLGVYERLKQLNARSAGAM